MNRDPPKANAGAVTALTNHLLCEGSLEGWYASHEDTNYLDVFMAAHNFHKAVVDDVARRWWEEQGIPTAGTYTMAVDTFRAAMEQRIRDGLPPWKTIIEDHQDADAGKP